MARAAKADSGILILRTPAQIRAILPPVRVEIIERLKGGPPRSIAELARAMDCRPTALTYHVNRLAEAGVLVRAKTRSTRGRSETLYRLAKERIAAAATVGENAQLVTAAVSAGLRLAQRELEAAIESGALGRPGLPIVPGRRMRAHLTRADLRSVLRKLKEIESIFKARQDCRGGRSHTLTYVLVPLAERKRTKKR